VNVPPRLRPTVLLGGIAAALALGLLFELLRDHTVRRAPVASASFEAPAAGPRAWSPAEALRGDPEAIVERPLFSATRRPATVAEIAEQVTGQPAQLPDWRLTGIVIANGTRNAMLWDTRERRSLMLAEGASEGGWRVAEVGAQHVVIERDGARHELPLRQY
jgi:hypothetical protein